MFADEKMTSGWEQQLKEEKLMNNIRKWGNYMSDLTLTIVHFPSLNDIWIYDWYCCFVSKKKCVTSSSEEPTKDATVTIHLLQVQRSISSSLLKSNFKMAAKKMELIAAMALYDVPWCQYNYICRRDSLKQTHFLPELLQISSRTADSCGCGTHRPVAATQTSSRVRTAARRARHFSNRPSRFEPQPINVFPEPTASSLILPP